MLRIHQFLVVVLFALGSTCSLAQGSSGPFEFPAQTAVADTSRAQATALLAQHMLATHQDANRDRFLAVQLRLQLLAGRFTDALTTIAQIRDAQRSSDPVFAEALHVQYEIFAKAKIIESHESKTFNDAFAIAFRDVFAKLDDRVAVRAAEIFTYNLQFSVAAQNKILDARADKTRLTLQEARSFVAQYLPFAVYRQILPVVSPLLAEDDTRRFVIDEGVLVKTKEGATLSVTVARQRGVAQPQPATLFYNIYVDEQRTVQRNEAKFAASRGYVGVAADARGKGLSPDKIEPFEHEVNDVNGVIDWISKQAWSDGRVGMYGGSYNGFAQWAALKRKHPALKTIVPYVASIPGLGFPMENNVFLTANYGWAFYVTNNRFLDNETYGDRARWVRLTQAWYESGRPFSKIDQVDGTPNPLLQRWLQHPTYDKFWQRMVPYKQDYANINIPILSITGYYDDGQLSAIEYVKEHYKYNPRANHTLLIGPYDHPGAQLRTKPIVLNGYTIDPVAQMDTPGITFEWFDYILRGAARPALLKDKINYQVMGANSWKHAPSLAAMSNRTLKLYLTSAKSSDHYRLDQARPTARNALLQTVDFADRKTTNNDYYPNPIVQTEFEVGNSLSFISEPLTSPMSVNGTFSGELKARINKKDMDVGVVLYEVTPKGEYFHLSYFLGRASHAKDMSVRRLLTPGKIETIPFERTRMVSRQLSKGSRLLVVLNINKNPFAQINYGTGKPVNSESIADAKVPLKVQWFNDSFVSIPVYEDRAQ